MRMPVCLHQGITAVSAQCTALEQPTYHGQQHAACMEQLCVKGCVLAATSSS